MKRYIALLRGVNISGKNKVSMAQLKQLFEDLDYKEVKTYLNAVMSFSQVMKMI